MSNQPPDIPPTDPARFPDFETLEAGLSQVLLSERAGLANSDAFRGAAVCVLRREANEYASTFASELVDCRLPDGRELTVFCKYSHGYRQTTPSPRHGLTFEANVYESVLRPLHISQVRCYGTHHEPHSAESWLVLEYLPDALWASHYYNLDAMLDSARWIALFHTLNRQRISDPALAFLPRYTAANYSFWSRQTWALCEAAGLTPEWLRPLCEHYQRVCVPLLAAQTPTVIHGELTPRNSLWHAGQIKPVDWETTAVGVGEIDLAILTYDWEVDAIAECEHAYRVARWPDGGCRHFNELLTAARLYASFHWIYDVSEQVRPEELVGHLRELKKVADRQRLT